MLLGIRDFFVSAVLFRGMVWLSCFSSLSGQRYLLGNMKGSLWRERKGECILTLDTLNEIIVDIILFLEETLETTCMRDSGSYFSGGPRSVAFLHTEKKRGLSHHFTWP